MTDLIRRKYSNPNILSAVCQVLVDWDSQTLQAFCERIQSEAFTTFQGVQKNSQQIYQFTFGTAGDPPPSVTQTAEGLEISADPEGSKIIIDGSGFRVHLAAPYKGRQYLASLTDWVLVRVREFDQTRIATRVSVLFESNIIPREMGGYKIEDYITPVFELADPRLNSFNSFFHSVFINLGEIQPGPFRCRIELSSEIKRPGISVLVDVLDDRGTTMEEVQNRLSLVKSLESHVFESLITDKTRELYGVIVS